MVGYFILAIFFVLVIVISSGTMMNVAEMWFQKAKHSRIFFATVALGLVAALPEIAIVLAATIQNNPHIALGNSLGANIANIGLVVGVMVAVIGVVPVVGEYLSINLWMTVVMALLPFLLMVDGDLSRFDGTTLLFGYLLYLYFEIKANMFELKQEKILKRKLIHKDLLSAPVSNLLMFLIGFSTLVICSIFLVMLMDNMSLTYGVSGFWIGLVVLALVTTIPELIIGLFSGEKKSITLTLQKLLGSIVTNSTLALGLLAIISPLTSQESISKAVAGVFTVAILGLFWLFTKSKRKIQRWEGAVLFGMYLMFVGLQMLFL